MSEGADDQETELLEICDRILAGELIPADSEEWAKLAKQYKRLSKNFQKILKVSDRNERTLQKISQDVGVEKLRFERLSDQLAKYLPRQVFESILAGDQAASIATKRRRLSVFFSDICGFTTISESLQPEILTQYMNRYFSAMSDLAHEYGGTIDKFIGDAIMIFFGDPESLGERGDAQQCVKMAMAMQKRLAELAIEWSAEGFQPGFIVRMGINTGYCNVGNFGSSDRMAYTILGAEVNLAARLEGAADPGGILLSQDTALLVGDLFELEEREPIKLKGISRPIRTFAVKRALTDSDSAAAIHEILLPDGHRMAINLAELSLAERNRLFAELSHFISKLDQSIGTGEISTEITAVLQD